MHATLDSRVNPKLVILGTVVPRRVLITGGAGFTGFVGSHLTDLMLKNGYGVRIHQASSYHDFW
jgi:hypothetical protein